MDALAVILVMILVASLIAGMTPNETIPRKRRRDEEP